MNTAFVSVPYLYALLDAGGGTEGFIQQLALGQHITASTRNPYDELQFTRGLHAQPRPR
jgi:hypothetical protein